MGVPHAGPAEALAIPLRRTSCRTMAPSLPPCSLPFFSHTPDASRGGPIVCYSFTMKRVSVALLLGFVLLPAAWPQAKNPFLGRWDLTLTPPVLGFSASWMGVSEKQGKLEVFFQATAAHVIPVASFKIRGSHMSVVVNKATKRDSALTLELDVANGKITGVQKRRNQTNSIVGVPAPEMKRSAPAAWTDPVPLFNGKNLDGWEAVGSAKELNWEVKDGVLVNEARGVNIRTTRKFDDFKVHSKCAAPSAPTAGSFCAGAMRSRSPADPAARLPRRLHQRRLTAGRPRRRTRRLRFDRRSRHGCSLWPCRTLLSRIDSARWLGQVRHNARGPHYHYRAQRRNHHRSKGNRRHHRQRSRLQRRGARSLLHPGRSHGQRQVPQSDGFGPQVLRTAGGTRFGLGRRLRRRPRPHFFR